MSEIICKKCGATYTSDTEIVPEFTCICENQEFEVKT